MRWEMVYGSGAASEAAPDGRKTLPPWWGPGPRWGHTVNAVKGGRFLYLFGGYGSDNCQTNDVHVFDTITRTWSKPIISGVPPSPRDSHTCTTVGDDLFVFGGTNGIKPLKDLHILDTLSYTWIVPKIHGNGPGAREGHSAAVVGKKIFIFGGCGKSRDNPEDAYYNDLYILDAENLVWERAVTSGHPPSARDSHSCSSWRNKLIVVGGENSSDYYLSDVHVLDTETLVWSELNTSGPMLPPRAGHCTVALGNNLFVFGGFTDDKNLYDDLHILDADTGIWKRVENLNLGPSARFSAAGDCMNSKEGILVFIGGCNATLEALDDMYFLHPDENGNGELKETKFSFKRELKRKCQELSTSLHEMRDLYPSPGVIPLLHRAVPGDSSCNLRYEDMPFQAFITGAAPNGYTIETRIDGKLLQGFIFSPQMNSYDSY